MRKLQTKDLFCAMGAIKEAKIKDELVPIMLTAAKEGKAAENIGITGILTLLELFSSAKAENSVYKFLAGPFEMEPKDIAVMEIGELAEKLDTLSKENDLKNFFTILSNMIKTRP